jgi:hypothetical protein
MFTSTVAPQDSQLDARSGQRALPGGLKQFYVLAYDEKSAVVSQEPLGRIIELGASTADDKIHHHTSSDHRLDNAADIRRRVDEALTRMQRTALNGDDEAWAQAKHDYAHYLEEEKKTFQNPDQAPRQHP